MRQNTPYKHRWCVHARADRGRGGVDASHLPRGCGWYRVSSRSNSNCCPYRLLCKKRRKPFRVKRGRRWLVRSDIVRDCIEHNHAHRLTHEDHRFKKYKIPLLFIHYGDKQDSNRGYGAGRRRHCRAQQPEQASFVSHDPRRRYRVTISIHTHTHTQ